MPGNRVKNNKKARNKSISFKICFLSMMILSVIFVSYAYLSCSDSISEINEQYRDRALSLVTMVDATINSKADLDDKSSIQQSFDELKRIDKKVLKISLYVKQSDGRVIRTVSSAHDEIGEPADSFDAAPIKTGQTVWEERYQGESQKENSGQEESSGKSKAAVKEDKDVAGNVNKDEDLAKGETEEEDFKAEHMVEILAPIYADGKRQASLGVYMDLGPKDAAVTDYVRRAVFYTFIALISLVSLLYLAIRRELFRPLSYLTEGVKEVAIGNLDRRVNLCRNDELGELSQEFDNMTESLMQREEENKQLLRSLKEKWVEAEEKSHTDYLTRLENHRSFQDRLESEVSLALRKQTNLSMIFCDIDSFKGFNDINGHLLGDKALFEVAEIIGNSIRDYDVAARYGGEEFAIIMPQTEQKEAYVVAERIRSNVEDHLFSTKFGLGYLTLSIGIATYPCDAADKESIIAAADSAMYASKYAGRNRVSVFSLIKHNKKDAS